MNSDEIRAVAQAITDAHANKPGNDYSGRTDDAKTMIAAFDAIQAFRAANAHQKKLAAVAVSVEAEVKTQKIIADLSAAGDEPSAASADNVTPIKPKAKGKKA